MKKTSKILFKFDFGYWDDRAQIYSIESNHVKLTAPEIKIIVNLMEEEIKKGIPECSITQEFLKNKYIIQINTTHVTNEEIMPLLTRLHNKIHSLLVSD